MSDGTTVNISVDTGGLQESMDASLGAITALSESVKNLEQYMKNIYEHTKTTRDCIVHIHDSHLHSSPHLCEDMFDTPPGSPWLNVPPSLPERLIMEYNNNMDYDFNGLIFGHDFMISKDDPQKPPYLAQMEHVVRPSKKMKRMTWASYLATLPKKM